MIHLLRTDHDISNEWDIFLSGYQDSKITSLQEIVEFNKQNADKALPPRKKSIIRNICHQEILTSAI